MYIVIEGQDGTGKSTQVRLLKDYFEKQGKEVAIMDEPDGDLPQARDLHDMILARGYDLESLTNFLLFTASRNELWHKIAEPVLKRGGIVISARNWWSSIAYQGYGEGVSKTKIIRMTKSVLPKKYYKPDFGIILTTSDDIRLARQGVRDKKRETFEKKDTDFQTRVNAAYPRIAEEFDIEIIDASGTIEEVFDKILSSLRKQSVL